MDEHDAWQQRVAEAGVHPTPVIDRFYFRSIYFREATGVLFEIATKGPGFATDEPIEHLGERLSLPPAFEHLREQLDGVLTPLPETRPGRVARGPVGSGSGLTPFMCDRLRLPDGFRLSQTPTGSVRISPAISTAAAAASAPLLPCAPPARASACSSVSAVTTPNATGTPVSRAASVMPRAASAQT